MFSSTAIWNRACGLAITISCIALSMAIAPQASADLGDQKTVVTFSAPVEIPGKILPAGTYVFKVLVTGGNRNVVQVFDKDEKKLYATLLTIPNYRMTASDKPIVRFEERPSGQAEAIEAWFYPENSYGHEFVYPHTRAVALAKRTNHNVLSMRDDMTKNISASSKSGNESSVQEMRNTEVTGVNPTGEPVDAGVIVSTAP